MQPIIGSTGTRRRSEITAYPSSSGICRATVWSVYRPSAPKPGSQTLQLRWISMSRISTRRASPGSAPSTNTGPVTRLNVSSPMSSSASPFASRSYAMSPVSKRTVAPSATRACGG